MNRWLLLLLCGCGDPAALGTLQLPLAADLPAGIGALEIRLDGAVRRSLTAPFPDRVTLTVDPGPQPPLELIATVDGRAAWYAIAEDLEAVAGQTTAATLILDPGGVIGVFTNGASLGVEISLEAVPLAPPVGTPTRYAIPLVGAGYQRVVPVGSYDIVAVVQLGPGLGSARSDPYRVEVEQGGRSDTFPDIRDFL